MRIDDAVSEHGSECAPDQLGGVSDGLRSFSSDAISLVEDGGDPLLLCEGGKGERGRHDYPIRYSRIARPCGLTNHLGDELWRPYPVEKVLAAQMLPICTQYAETR